MFSNFYHSFYYSCLIAGALVALAFFRRLSAPMKWLAALMILTLINECVAKYISATLKQNNNALYHVFTVVEYYFYIRVYSYFLTERKNLLQLSVLFLLVCEILNLIFLQGFNTSDTNIILLESVLLVCVSLALFNDIRQRRVYKNLLTESVFWFNSAVLFYYAYGVLYWGFHSLKIYRWVNPPVIIYHANLILSGLLYLVYSYALILNYSNNKNHKQ